MKNIFNDALKRKREINDNVTRTEKILAKVKLSIPTKWKKMYEKLVGYKEKHGHCMVPLRCTYDPKLNALGRWVGNQRFFYKKYKNGESNRITLQRINALDKIGFVWNLNDYRWQMKYKELVSHCAKTGCRFIPCKFDSNPGLAVWCSTQRNQWYRHKIGLPNTLSIDRMRALNKIGFVFEAKKQDTSDN